MIARLVCISIAWLASIAATAGCGGSAGSDAGPADTISIDSSTVPLPDPACGDMGGLQPGSPWPMRGYCPTRIARSPSSGPVSPRKRWQVPLPGQAAGLAIGADNTTYVATRQGTIHALSPAGLEAWRTAELGSISKGSPTIARDGSILVCAGDQLVALAPDGEQRWTFRADSSVGTSSPLVQGDGTIRFTSTGGFLYAVSPSGKELRRTKVAEYQQGSVAVEPGGALFLARGDDDARASVALNPDDSIRWEGPFKGRHYATPMVGSNGQTYWATGGYDNSFYALDAQGAREWVAQLARDAIDADNALGPADTVIVDTTDLAIIETFTATGERGWSFQGHSPIVDRAGIVYCCDGSDGTLKVRAISPSGEELWSFPSDVHDGVCAPAALDAEGALVVGIGSWVLALGD